MTLLIWFLYHKLLRRYLSNSGSCPTWTVLRGHNIFKRKCVWHSLLLEKIFITKKFTQIIIQTNLQKMTSWSLPLEKWKKKCLKVLDFRYKHTITLPHSSEKIFSKTSQLRFCKKENKKKRDYVRSSHLVGNWCRNLQCFFNHEIYFKGSFVKGSIVDAYWLEKIYQLNTRNMM